MKKDLFILGAITVVIVGVYWRAILSFFTQDDFILINNFSQNNIFGDIKNVWLSPVTHWRPMHNLYFFVGGNLFGKSYWAYHLITFIIHIGISFLIFKTAEFFFKNRWAGLFCATIYGVSPVHFVSIFWISGSATTLGFFFLLLAFYSFIHKKTKLALLSYLASLLASEAMVVGIFLFFAYQILLERKFLRSFSLAAIALSAIYLFLKLSFFTPSVVFDIYKIEFSPRVFGAGIYYLARILGFAEISTDRILTLVILLVLSVISFVFLRRLSNLNLDKLVFFSLILIFGLFPFVLIPDKLSPHYMNVSLWGYTQIIALVLRERKTLMLLILLVLTTVSILGVDLTYENNWVIARSKHAKAIIDQVELLSPAAGSKLIFVNSPFLPSREAYIVLGQGEALKFWFSDRNYIACFEAFENCAGGGGIKI